MYMKPVQCIYTGFDNFLHYSLQGFKVYAVLNVYFFTCTTQIPGNWRCNDNNCLQL